MLQRFHADWDVRRRGREFPARRDFDPCDLRYALGYISLIDVLGDPPRFRFRLHGVGNAERVGIDMTGKLLEAMPDGRRYRLVSMHYSAVMKEREPVAQTRRVYAIDERAWNCEVLVLPLSSDGINIDMLMSCAAWADGGTSMRSAVPLAAGFQGRS
jgi:hypothetical protein